MADKHHHYHVKPKDSAVEEADLRLRRAHQAKLNEPHAGGRRLKQLQDEERAAHKAYQAAHAMPDTLVCDKCGAEFLLNEGVIIPFMRVIRFGEFVMDSNSEKFIRLCGGCDRKLGLIQYP